MKVPVKLSRFTVTDQGLTCTDEKGEEIRICSPLFVDAVTRDHQGKNCGRLIRWTDAEGREHYWMMPVSMLAGDMTSVISRLLDEGVQISSNRKARELLGEYLQSTVDNKLICVSQIGWYGESFVLPDTAFSPPGCERIVFQTHDDYRFRDMLPHGSLQGWQDTIGQWCKGNTRLMFAVCVAFAGPLLEMAGEQGGGFHFFGLTSGGKTTLLRAAASIIGSSKMVRTWRTTDNGLEGTAVAHNHITLFLDEIGQLLPAHASDVAPRLSHVGYELRLH